MRTRKENTLNAPNSTAVRRATNPTANENSMSQNDNNHCGVRPQTRLSTRHMAAVNIDNVRNDNCMANPCGQRGRR
ncbi:hypothetical protein D3C71_2058540 [compost metagenome]